MEGPGRGIREIPLEPGAQGVVISASADRATRRTSDGRRPVENGSEFFDASVYQVRASGTTSGPPAHRGAALPQPVLEPEDLIVLTAWAEALAEALTFAPERVEAVPAAAHAGAPWRAELGISEPSPQVDRAIDSIDEALGTALLAGRTRHRTQYSPRFVTVGPASQRSTC